MSSARSATTTVRPRAGSPQRPRQAPSGGQTRCAVEFRSPSPCPLSLRTGHTRLPPRRPAAPLEVTVGADGALGDDVARVEAVRDAIGPVGAVRCTVDGAWDVDTAVATIAVLEKAAGGLEFVEQPCLTVEELVAVRRKVDVRIALDVSARHADDPHSVPFTDAADVVVLKSGPLGGVRRALRVAELSGLPCVVSSSRESSVGLSGGLALAGALPELPYACGLGTIALLTGDLVARARSLQPVDGWLPVAPMPPAPDPDRMGPFTQTDPQRVQWWRALLQRARSFS